MTSFAAASAPDPIPVVLTSSALRIYDMTVAGPAFEAVSRAVAAGEVPEVALSRVLHVGGSVLLAGPHHNLLDAVDERVARVLDALDARADGFVRLRAVAETAAAKGTAFEDLVAPVLERCFAPFGDVVEDTSRTAGIDGRSKHGDFTVTLAGEDTGRVAVEVKDRPTLKLAGASGALTALRQAMANREAQVGVLVCATPTPALASQRLRLYGADQILVLLDKDDPDPLALEIACQLARALATHSRSGGEEVDASLVADSVTRLREILDAASEIKRGAQEAARGIKRVEAGYADLVEQASGVIERLAEGGS